MCSRSTSNVWSRTVSDAVRLDPIEDAIAGIRRGELVLVVDDEDRENEGDFIFAAELSTPELMAFAVRYSTGVICAPMVGEDLDRLQIPPMTAVNQDQKGTAYTVSVDAVAVESTGISAADRSTTVRTLADPTSTASDFTRPGHVFPLRAVPGGVLRRAGHTEATVDLCRLAGLRPLVLQADVRSHPAQDVDDTRAGGVDPNAAYCDLRVRVGGTQH